MSLSYTTTEGTLIIPGAYPTIKVAAEASGISANGIVTLIGEADAGPDRSLEDDLEANAFGVDQVAAVVAKYRSGNLVEAMRAIASPANDVAINGGPSRVILVKTNVSTKATRNLVNFAATTYGVIADRSFGRLGNLIQSQLLASQAESLPTTGAFTYIPPVGSVNLELRVNGGLALPATLSANTTPTNFVSTVNGLAGPLATGGVDRVAHPTTGNLALSVVGGTGTSRNVTITTTSTFPVVPTAGDTLVIGAASVITGVGGASGDNVGAYVVTAASSTSISATKLSDAGQTGAVIGGPVNCADVTSVAVGGTPANNLVVYSPAVITLEAGNPIDGVGKTLEIAQATGGSDLLERCAFVLATTTAVSWVSRSTASARLTSVAEYIAQLSLSRQADGVSEDLVAGGEVALNVGYTGTSATLSISSTTGILTTAVTGGSGANLSITLADFATIADLAAFINTQTGYSAAVESAVIGQLPTSALDFVTAAGICTTHGTRLGRVKVDAFRFFRKLADESALVQLQSVSGAVVRAAAGLPAAQAAGFLAGGAKGGTTAANVTAAIDALERVSTNFVVPLFSRDASADIADNLTDSSSTYTIDGINAALKTHVNKMSTLKRRRHRQGFCSKRTTFANARESAANLAAYRCSLTFQDVRLVSGSGVITQFQPWMGAVLAAGMQAAGFYRALVNKGVNCSGVLQAAKDFDDRDLTQVEQALVAGLLIMAKKPTGGFAWVSDQTTYSRDSNFVYNSIQATYSADLVALSTAQRMESAFLGQSVADVSAALAKATLDSIMNDFVRLKLIAGSDDAPKGYKNAVVQISGPVMLVSLEIKLAGAIYFIPISFVVSQVQQSA
jgi:hypothetical protein